MIYAVVPMEEAEYDLLEIVQRIDPAAYVSYSPRIYFVRFDGTSTSLASAVGFTAETRAQEGIVIPVDNDFGYANLDLWKWMEK